MIQNQTLIFFVYFISGIIICVIFDFFRSLRKSIKTTDIVTYIEDVVFFIITGIILILLIYRFNIGELRFYIPVAIIIGGICYYLTISKLLIKLNVGIIKLTKNTVSHIISIIFKLLGKPIYFFIINLKKIAKKVKK